MNKLLLSALAVTTLAACTPSRSGTPDAADAAEQIIQVPSPIADSAAIVADTKAPQALIAPGFTELDTSGILLFPLAFPSDGDKSYTGSLKSRNESPGYWNFIFSDSKAGTSRLLTRDKILFLDYNYNQPTASDVPLPPLPYLFFSGVATDYNKDKYLTSSDPVYLYVSDRAGNNFHRISPENCSLVRWNRINATDQLLLTVMRDTNRDRAFTEEDETAQIMVDLASGRPGTELFQQNFKNEIKVLYNQQWNQRTNKE
jgi:hypothetical protein